jgi:beta-xylosidase
VTGYRNPILPGFFPDPSVCRFGDDFLLVTSSFTCFPGVPIFRSPDLVNWTQVGNVLDRASQLDLSQTVGWPGLGVYAPTIRCHDGRLWLIVTVTKASFTDRLDTFFVTADDPAGPWSDPVVLDLPEIDPDLAWDDDGRCFVHISGIHRCEIDDTTGAVLAGPELAWPGTGLFGPEGPHLLRRGPWWYLLIAEGGTYEGHAVTIARSPSPTGPWEPGPANPILSHRSSNHPIQNTGHADLVEAPDGTWWMVLLGVRPSGAAPGFHVLGRETFLVPVDWVDDWPVPRQLDLEMPAAPLDARQLPDVGGRDDFDSTALAPAWVAVRRPLGDAACLSNRAGWLTLHGGEADLDSPTPTLLAQRQRALRCSARTLVEVQDAGEAGLGVLMDERHHYEVAVRGDEVVVRARIGDLSSVVGQAGAPEAPVVLRIDTHDDYGGDAGPAPDRLRLGFETEDGSFEVLADLDGRYLSTEVATGFSGRLVGLYAVGGTARFDWFELT